MCVLCKLLRGPGRVRIMQMRLSGRGGLGGVLGEHSRYHLSGPQTSGSEEALAVSHHPHCQGEGGCSLQEVAKISFKGSSLCWDRLEDG